MNPRILEIVFIHDSGEGHDILFFAHVVHSRGPTFFSDSIGGGKHIIGLLALEPNCSYTDECT